MSATKRAFTLLLIIVACLIVFAPIVKWIVDMLLPHSAWLQHKVRFDEASGTYRFGRVFRRCLMVFTLLVSVVLYQWAKVPEYVKSAYVPQRWREHFFPSFIAGAGFFSLSVGLLLVLGARHLLQETGGVARVASEISAAVLAGLAVGFLEETVFRAYLFRAFASGLGVARAAAFSAVIFSSLHFLKTPIRVPSRPSFADLGLGFRCLTEILFRSPTAEGLRLFVGLFFVGLFLALFTARFSVYAAVGLHAGWVFTIKAQKAWIAPADVHSWIWGGDLLVNGLYGCLMLVLSSFVVWRILAIAERRPPGNDEGEEET